MPPGVYIYVYISRQFQGNVADVHCYANLEFCAHAMRAWSMLSCAAARAFGRHGGPLMPQILQKHNTFFTDGQDPFARRIIFNALSTGIKQVLLFTRILTTREPPQPPKCTHSFADLQSRYKYLQKGACSIHIYMVVL